MPNATLLAASIRAALDRPHRPAVSSPSVGDLADDAQDALTCIEAVMASISKVGRAFANERSFIALQLLRGSCDHGRALTYILANNPLDLAAPALALHRSQIEMFLRSAFFAYIASETEFRDFIENDKGPRRQSAKGKWTKIPVEDLAFEVQSRLHEVEGETAPEDGKLARMVENAWDPLCALVHGGRAMHALYLDDRNEIGCAVPPEVHVQTTVNAVAIVNFSLTLAATIAGMAPEEENEALAAPLAAFHTYVDRRNARLTRLGMHNEVRRLD